MIEINPCGEEPASFPEVVAAAVADAGLPHEQVVVFGCPGQSSSQGYLAMAYPRHDDIDPGPNDMDLGPRLALANSPQHLGGFRVAVCVAYPEPLVAALLRHELEHCRQFDATDRDADWLHHRAVEALQLAVDVPESGRLYGLIPMEQDANAAAALFVRSRFGSDHIDDLAAQHPDSRSLLRLPNDPPDVATIDERMRHFILHDGPRIARSAVDAGKVSHLVL